jgi:uncharacterized protein (DUF4213/DUF364 family)
MTLEELFETLRAKLNDVVSEDDLLKFPVEVSCRALSAQEAIGNTLRKDYPLLNGKDVMVQAEIHGGIGQVFTQSPVEFRGTVEEILKLDIVNNAYDRTIFIASLNAVMQKYRQVNCTVHCKGNQPEKCAQAIGDWIEAKYGHPKIAQIGFQPAMLANLSQRFDVRVLDINPNTVGTVQSGIKVLDGVRDYQQTVVEWADIVLCTGSTLSNGTIVNFLDLDKDVYFYGTTIAGAAELMGLKRLCYADSE